MNLPESHCPQCGIRIGSEGHDAECPGEDSRPAPCSRCVDLENALRKIISIGQGADECWDMLTAIDDVAETILNANSQVEPPDRVGSTTSSNP